MTGKLLLLGAAALTVVGVSGGGIASAEPAAPQDSVVGAPLPLEPAPAPAPAPPAQGAPLPSPAEVSGMLDRLSDAGIGYKEKGNLVENGIDQHEGHGLDSELRKAYRDGELPYNFDVLSVSPTTPGQAIATVTISGPKTPPQTTPLQLVDQGSWVLSHDSATQLFQVLAAH